MAKKHTVDIHTHQEYGGRYCSEEIAPCSKAAIAILEAEKQCRELLRNSFLDTDEEIQSRYTALVEQGDIGIVESDADAIITYANNKLGRIINYCSGEVVGRSMFDFMSCDQAEITRQRLQKRRQGLADAYVGTLQKKYGEPVGVQIAANPLQFSRDGRYRGAVAIVINLSERKLQEEERFVHDRIEAKLAQVVPRLDKLRKEFSQLIEESLRIEQQGYTYARPTYRQGKYLVLVHQKEKGERKREYVGSDQSAINQALAKAVRGLRHKALKQEQENIDKRLRSVGFKLDQVLEIITPSIFDQF
jgi:PAS domain S-box-containing protein